MRTPEAGARMERAGARLAPRRANARSTRLHHCATFAKRCAMMRLNALRAIATACERHAG
eukprot:11209596-Lingulodinium_polyedra.AAC.1